MARAVDWRSLCWVALAGPMLHAQVEAIARVVADAEARGVRTGVAVCAADGSVLYRHRVAEPFAPASNMKVLTAAAVLEGLGVDFVFRTEFRLREGALVVRSAGDPNWVADSVHAPERVFAQLARELRARDVTRIRAVELEPGSFVGPERPPGWPADQHYAYYCAPTGPFALEQGTFKLRISAGNGAEARVALLAPPAGLPVRGAIDVVAQRGGATYGAIDEGDGVRVRGKFPHRSPAVEIRTAMRDTEAWFRAALATQLELAGVRLDPNFDGGGDGLVYVHESSLGPALLRMLEDSSNFDAEQLLRVLGDRTAGDGTLAGGVAALEAQLVKLVGEMPAGVVLRDGSGLTADNRITPGLLVVAMWRCVRGASGRALRDCLPIAGRTGTLEDRFRGTDLVDRVRAKTGWIRGASSLSGMVDAADGSVRWFSILMNYDRARNGLNADLKRMQEEIVAAVARSEPER